MIAIRSLRARRAGFPSVAALLALGLAAALAAGCGYTLGTSLPPGLRSIHVPPFVNRSGEPLIEITATQATVEEFQRDGNLKVVPLDRADLVLDVTISGYKLEPVRYDKDDTRKTAEYRVRLTADVVLRKTDARDVMMRRTVEGENTFVVVGDITGSKQTALPKAAGDLGRNIVEKIVEYW